MSNLLAYSGITTKVKAMQSRLLTKEQFREMAALEQVADAVDYLKQLPAYEDILGDLETSQFHRGFIEQRLTLSEYRDFAKLYRFSSLSGRKFLNLYFMHYEIAILKKCLRNVMSHTELHLDLSIFQEFFDKHSKLNLMKLSASENLPELISNLEGSPYYDLLAPLSDTSDPTLFDYEMHLDLLYFKTLFSKRNQPALSGCIGSKLDMLNIQWIYRSKKYYNLSPADIYALLIPSHYRLKPAQIQAMTEAEHVEDFFSALQNTFYGSLNLSSINSSPDLEHLYEQVLNRIHRISSQKNPYSTAILNSYLYFKELEIQKIITVIEGIRYGTDADTIYSYIIKDD